tara:strand:- start:2442 stop:2687 length:246 start_codon:yes stop_codon:yes gene_type:complete
MFSELTSVQDIDDPFVVRNFPDCPETLGTICAEEPEIVPLIVMPPQVKVPFAVMFPDASVKPPIPDRSLIDATFSVLILLL